MASLMEPTLFSFRNGGYINMNMSFDTAFPDPITYHRTLRPTAQSFMLPVQTTLSGGRRVRWSAQEATSIQPTSFAENVLAVYNSLGPLLKSNLTLSVTLPAPVTRVTCITPDTRTVLAPNDDVYYVMKDGVSVGVLGSINSMARRINGLGVIDKYTLYDGSKAPLNQRLDPIWLDPPDPEAPASIVVLFPWWTDATDPQSLDRLLAEFDPSSERMSLDVVTCRVSAYWNTAQASLAWNQGVRLPTETGPFAKLKPCNVRNITFNTTDIDMLHDAEFNKSVQYLPHIDLAVRFGLTISSLPHLSMLRHTGYPFWEWEREQWGYKLVDLKDTVKVTNIETDLYGNGYTIYSTSVCLSPAVILAYCTITIAYLGYILVTGSTSTGWNSTIELVALALQSKKPNYPGCTANGIDSLNTFQQGGGIRVNGDDELELVFASDRDLYAQGLRKIEKNVAY